MKKFNEILTKIIYTYCPKKWPKNMALKNTGTFKSKYCMVEIKRERF